MILVHFKTVTNANLQAVCPPPTRLPRRSAPAAIAPHSRVARLRRVLTEHAL